MKVLLLTPPSARLMNPITCEQDLVPPKAWVPLGIAYLAASLRARGFETELADLHDHTWEEVAALLTQSAPDVVGISCFTFGRVEAYRLASLVRKVLPRALVVMGGPHATFFPDHALDHSAVDVVVLGEGEETLVELCMEFSCGEDFHCVTGIAYRTPEGNRRTPPRKGRTDLSALPFPAYDTFDLSQYKSPEIPEYYRDMPGTHVLTSRGCPFHCTFCSVNTFFGGHAVRSPESVVDELEYLYAEHGVRHVYFSDDLFSLYPERTIGICKAILDRRLELAWMAETRVDCVNKEMLHWMRMAGCYRVYYGVESGSPRILRSIGKGFDVAQIRTAFQLTHQAGIQPSCFLMVGNPGETPETIRETVELMQEIRPATVPIMGITTLLPGTAQYEEAVKQGIIDDAYWLTDQAPPLHTGEYEVDDLIALQMQLARGVSPQLYEHLCAMGFDEGYFRLRRLGRESRA